MTLHALIFPNVRNGYLYKDCYLPNNICSGTYSELGSKLLFDIQCEFCNTIYSKLGMTIGSELYKEL
jgi:hypothetical protein